MWRSAVQKFSSGGSGFDPSFSETEKVMVVGVDQIRQCSRMKRMENGADVESAQSEVCWARIQFSVTRKEEKGEEKRTAETECALVSKEQGRNVMGVLLECREGSVSDIFILALIPMNSGRFIVWFRIFIVIFVTK